MRLTVRRAVFATSAMVLAAVLAVVALLGADVYLHRRAERSAGLNLWGYRGSIAPKKGPDEIRVVVLGGSTVFGYGLTSDQAFPALLEHKLNAHASGRAHYRVINLGYNNEGSFSFKYTLEDYAYLHPDVVCLYEGYNDLMGDANGGNPLIYRHQSPIFRATGYLPILPLILREKALALRFGGNLNEAYAAEGRTVFQPTLATKATSGALDAAADIGESLERQFARLSPADTGAPGRSGASGCAHPWSDYCQGVSDAIDYALAAGHRVVFVTQPYLTRERGRDRHHSQQQAVVAMLEQRYAGRPEMQYANLGDTVDLSQPTLATDGMHLTPAGNSRIADALVAPILTVSRPDRRVNR